MTYYCGLDVSLQETFVTIINQNGTKYKEKTLPSDPNLIAQYLNKLNINLKLVALESGQLSINMCHVLKQHHINVICVDARHMATLLKAQNINKNDKNDSLGIATMIKAGLYKEVAIKSHKSCQIQVLLRSRRQLVETKLKLQSTIRGLLKIYGIKLPLRSDFDKSQVLGLLDSSAEDSILSISSLLDSVRFLRKKLCILDERICDISRQDEDCILLETIPGVGPITALTYKSSLDNYDRFSRSCSVGAYMGLTPRQYSSGEIDRKGSISKRGPSECRTMLYEASQTLIMRSKKNFKLRFFGLRLMKKKGSKKAIVAVARRLSVIMHRMLIDRTEFIYS